MSDSDPVSSTPSASAPTTFKGRGFRIFGLGAQDVIRYFFGGNASLAIILVVLICFFLGREGVLFFPSHRKGLEEYRSAGQEFVDAIGAQIDAHTEIYSSANIAYFAEVNESSAREDQLLRAVRTVGANVETACRKSWKLLGRKLDELKAMDGELAATDLAEEARAVLVSRRATRQSEIEALRVVLRAEAEAALSSRKTWKLGADAKGLTDDERAKIRVAVLFAASPDAKEDHPWVAELKGISREKKNAAAVVLEPFKATLKSIQDAVRPLRSLHADLKKTALSNRSEINSFVTAPARKAAMLEGAKKATDPAEKARFQAEADSVKIEAPDLAAMNAPFYAAVPKHGELSSALLGEMARLREALPKEGANHRSDVALERAGRLFERFEKTVARSQREVGKWRHDRPVSTFSAFTSFVFGKQWITNSSWHDFYGLLPLLSGSLLIALIALLVAVPFSVAVAVYVNQLAPMREQNFVKPAIEFIGAIPSVVLGFFGIVVFGEALRSVSQIEWLSWVPGFPMSERLNILNAGLLLAFMAVPTIFTLVEDALENVPSALTENSLAMGASKLQTVFRVVVPTAVSGVIAAILLGFGRIIGETMVVLLVAGNKIKIPDFSEGTGVFTQPAHTMTGIIAQELPEVDNGSLHWRALFIVGMVLFTIALAVNFGAQQVLKRFQKI
ncbi:MAG TPA: phosphate ABC transporter permease subunit PstC [Bacteroidia bacterium]|nr:phosphate ABC transporter permease subunit PstC [Bacteroidia bacterium]